MASSVRGVAPMQRFLVRSASSGTGRQSLAISALSGAGRLHLPPPSSSTTGNYYCAAPTCRSDWQRYRRSLACSANPINYESVSFGNGARASRLMSSSAGPQYFEGPWYEKYLLLEEYKKEHGNCLVPRSFVFDNIKLGAWVSQQRELYKKGKLSQNRREMLDTLSFSWDPRRDKWERHFALLEQYKKREGHCNVPHLHEEDGIKLGWWLVTQRQTFKKGKLDESHQQRLEQLGISWGPLEDQWERHFALLEKFKKREGHCNVPSSYEEEGINLRNWLDRQRQIEKGNRGYKLSFERIERLEKLGISWDPLGDQWERNFALLQQFKDREGHCNVTQLHEEDGIKLGTWLDWQRQVRKGNKGGNLGVDRIAWLDKIGFRW